MTTPARLWGYLILRFSLRAKSSPKIYSLTVAQSHSTVDMTVLLQARTRLQAFSVPSPFQPVRPALGVRAAGSGLCQHPSALLMSISTITPASAPVQEALMTAMIQIPISTLVPLSFATGSITTATT